MNKINEGKNYFIFLIYKKLSLELKLELENNKTKREICR